MSQCIFNYTEPMIEVIGSMWLWSMLVWHRTHSSSRIVNNFLDFKFFRQLHMRSFQI